MRWFFFFLPAFVFATVNEPLRFELFSGYRNDRIHWHLQTEADPVLLAYSELYRDVEYWENGLVLRAIHRDISFFIRGSYSTFGRGTLFQDYPNTTGQPHFEFTTEGWAADVSGYLGYAVNLTADRTYKVILTPLIGYGANFEDLHRKGGTPKTFDGFTSELPQVFRLVWNGFLFGGCFRVEPGNGLILQAGYSYHLMHNRLKTAVLSGFAPSQMLQTIRSSSGGNSGQTGWAQIDWTLPRIWRMGIGGLIHYFSTRVVEASVQQSAAGDLTEKLKLRWTAISGWVQVSREF